jgi:hypothetical protein
MEVARNILFDGELLQGVHVTARPVSFGCGPIERPAANNLVLSLSGVFAQHTGPRRQVIATPHHALLLTADAPYRISFPAGRV